MFQRKDFLRRAVNLPDFFCKYFAEENKDLAIKRKLDIVVNSHTFVRSFVREVL